MHAQIEACTVFKDACIKKIASRNEVAVTAFEAKALALKSESSQKVVVVGEVLGGSRQARE